MPEHKLVQWKLPDIKNVLASSPGKAKFARYEKRTVSKSPVDQEKNNEGTPLLSRKSSQGQMKISYEANIARQVEDEAEEHKKYPRVTSSMMRQQLYKMNESLASLKRNRI